MVAVAAGSFDFAGKPVQVGAHCLDRTEVTVAAYARCVEAGKCSEAHDAKGEDHADCNWKEKGREQHPINCVDHAQAVAYCAFRGARLPTETEWEWSARGYDKGTTFPWGDEPIAARACWGGPGSAVGEDHEGTCPVGAYPTGDNPNGIHDLAGNVWEWTSTPGSAKGTFIDRGGCWLNAVASRLRATDRNDVPAIQQSPTLGLRCAAAAR